MARQIHPTTPAVAYYCELPGIGAIEFSFPDARDDEQGQETLLRFIQACRNGKPDPGSYQLLWWPGGNGDTLNARLAAQAEKCLGDPERVNGLGIGLLRFALGKLEAGALRVVDPVTAAIEECAQEAPGDAPSPAEGSAVPAEAPCEPSA